MPPDADKLRQRKNNLPQDNHDSSLRLRSLDSLTGDEVVIDGLVYNIANFQHPGGDQIKLFGGNDVSTTYKMIHPHSTNGIPKNLEPVARIEHYPQSEYDFGTPFELEMKREVFRIVRRGQEFATWGFYLRLVLYLSLYFSLMLLWVTTETNLLWLSVWFGVSQALVGLNVQHDANHGAVSKRFPAINDFLGLFADCIGYSKYLWIQQHWTHHAFTNSQEKDPDASAGEPAMIFYNYSQQDERRSWIHKFQAIFFLPLFCLYWVSTVFNIGQVMKLDHEGTKGAGMEFDSHYTKSRRKYALFLRALYHAIHIVIPICMRSKEPISSTLLHIWIMGVCGSLTLAVPFSLSHNFVGAERNPNSKSRDWFALQVETSCTYGGFVAAWLTGGLNFQIEHHLFPRMSSAWYPYIAPTVKRVCELYGVKYTYYPTILHNLISTIRYMHQVGNNSIEEKKER